MDAPTFPFTDDELKNAGLLGEGVSENAAQAIDTMRKHPERLKLSLSALQCINHQDKQNKSASSPRLPSSPALSDQTLSSNPAAVASETTVSKYSPDEYERTSYYNGIAGERDHPELVYRSDLHTTPFPKPTGRFAHLPVKSLRGVFDTPLNNVWGTVGPQIRDLIKAQNIHWSSIDTVRFFTHGPPGEDVKGTLGPVVIWIGVIPGSTSADTAHDVSQQILELLQKNGVEGVVVEWRDLEALYDEVAKYWSNIKLHRSIGYVQYAPAIKVDEEGGTRYTSDWAASLVAEAKVKVVFEGNVVDLGSKYSRKLTVMFYPVRGGPTTFKFPKGRMLRIEDCATMEDLAVSTELDSEGQRCLMVGKVVNATNLTVGRYAGLVPL
ncbi:uncharacterized protein L203_104852 [Cryptococcus depauperatus CBS 7841]|uniref:Uncharacterized protein n=1 Tax=Cryptococcus depauperatus CBS 7841 TaxID=1295531 RepID=A0AAJ8M2X3_9TREE